MHSVKTKIPLMICSAGDSGMYSAALLSKMMGKTVIVDTVMLWCSGYGFFMRIAPYTFYSALGGEKKDAC